MHIWLENHSDFLFFFFCKLTHKIADTHSRIWRVEQFIFISASTTLILRLIIFPRLVHMLLHQFHNTAQVDCFSFIFYLFS